MPAFYADHNVSLELAQRLRLMGHILVTARDLGLGWATDDEHLLVAARATQTLITHNRKDFVLLHNAWIRWTGEWGVEQQHGGILITPQTLAVSQAAIEIDKFTKAGQPLVGRLYEWRGGRWIRR